MRFFPVKQASCVKGEILLLGDKSIACRSIIISAISCGKTTVENFPPNKDCLWTIKTFKNLGIKITQNQNIKTITVFGNGLCGLKKPRGPIFVGDSGTTLRLTLGVLAGQNFAVTLTAGKSLAKRPMLRVTAPLRMMGTTIKAKINPPLSGGFGGLSPFAKASGEQNKESTLRLRSGLMVSEVEPSKIEEYPPLTVRGGKLKPITYKLPVASAQVKSAILLAGLYAKGMTKVIEPIKTRDHTERLLKLFKADLKVKKNEVVIRGIRELISPGRIFIPGDISSAGFFMVLGTILPNSRILIKDINLNPSRIGIIKVLKRMGSDIQVLGNSTVGFEPIGDIIIKSSKLKSTIIRKKEIPSLIDELPILMVAACFAKGESVFEGVSELRIKETDRIRSMSENLKKMGADIRVLSATSRGGSAKFATKNGESAKHFGGNFGGKTARSEKIIIQGGGTLIGATVRSFGDHRTAMSMVVAGLAAIGETRIDNISCINKSFPGFLNILKTLIR